MINTENTIIIGDGYIGSFLNNEIKNQIKDFRFNGFNSDEIEKIFLNKITTKTKYLINCTADTNTVNNDLNHFKKSFISNSLFVFFLNNFCSKNALKLIHISTGDIYGNGSFFSEDSGAVDINTNYRFTKHLGEKLCDSDSLILRIRLPFDDRKHPKNSLYKFMNFEFLMDEDNSMTYLPDLLNSINRLVENDQSGTFNVCCIDYSSPYKILNFLGYDVVKKWENPNPPVHIVNNTLSTEKLIPFHFPVDITSSMQYCYSKLK
jgi:dTDP-4-dehydrorhamnose reductase